MTDWHYEYAVGKTNLSIYHDEADAIRWCDFLLGEQLDRIRSLAEQEQAIHETEPLGTSNTYRRLLKDRLEDPPTVRRRKVTKWEVIHP